jgi:HSP20 family molecular chaperone IbpA
MLGWTKGGGMSAMPMIGPRRELPPHASVSEEPAEYLIELDVSDFALGDLTVEVVGSRLVVRGEQLGDEDAGKPFALEERLEETMRLPDDVDPDRVTAIYKHGTLELHARRRKIPRRRVPIERDYLINPTPQGC